jgi:hypothetical protein
MQTCAISLTARATTSMRLSHVQRGSESVSGEQFFLKPSTLSSDRNASRNSSKFLTGKPTGTQSPPCLCLGPTQPVAALFTSRTPPILPAQRKERKEKAPFVNIVYCLITSPSELKTICPLPRHLHLLPTTLCKYLSCLSSIRARTAKANNTCSNSSTASNKTNTPPHTAH